MRAMRDDIDGEDMGTPPRTVRLWPRLVVGALAVTAIVAGALLAGALAADAKYGDSRWQYANRAVCITTKYINTTAVKDAVKRSAAVWSENTVLDVRVRNDCYDLGYSQRIVVYDRKYSQKASGWVEFKGGFKAFQPKTTGPWLSGSTWAWAHQSPVIVKINRTYTDGSASWRQRVVSHEIGHALGLGHNRECKSVMTTKTRADECSVMFKLGGYWDWKGTSSNPGINRIYANGRRRHGRCGYRRPREGRRRAVRLLS